MKIQSVAVISSYPPSGSTHHKKLVGVASYAKNTLLAVKKVAPDVEITVLAEHIDNSEKLIVESDHGISIKRVWRRNSLFIFPALLKELFKSPASTVLIELELAMFGGILSLLPFPLFLLVLQLMGKKTVIVMHQVIPDLEEMHGHIGLKSNSVKIFLLNFCVRLLYQVIGLFSDTIIVFEEALKDNLSSITYNLSSKIIVIPHMVEDFGHIPTQQSARKELGIPTESTVLLYFGFLAWYKGADMLVDQISKFKFQSSNFKLIMAGGPNPNHMDKPFYKKYIDDIEKKASHSNITITGFVDEEKIPLYFAASDIVIFPYRTFMSSSGPLSLGFSFEKAVLLSENLTPYAKTSDFSKALEHSQLTMSDITYPLTSDGLTEKLDHLSKAQISTLAEFSRIIKQSRTSATIGHMYYEALFS